MNSMACDNFMQGTFVSNGDICTDAGGEEEEEVTGSSSSSSSSSSSCDVSMTNPTVTSCSSASNDGTTTMKVAYDHVQVDCGDAIALTTASNTVPVIHVAEESNSINADAYYSLLLVDT